MKLAARYKISINSQLIDLMFIQHCSTDMFHNISGNTAL